MLIGVGTDIVEIKRIKASLDRLGDRFAERILTNSELEQYRQNGDGVAFIAKRFAAKEAVVKALGTGIGNGVSWQHIIVRSNSLGAPEVELQGYALERMQELGGACCLLSIADEREYAVAFAVIAK